MTQEDGKAAFGAPGIEPRWTRSTKEGIGTAYHSSCRVWFTLSHGIINEIYYPNVDCPNTRDLQFLITDGKTFCHEERRDLESTIEYPEKGALFYRLTTSEPKGRYRLIKDVIADPHSSVFLMKTRLEIMDEQLRGKLRLFALLSPHLKGLGQHNSGWWKEVDCRPIFYANRENIHMTFGAWPDFLRRSVGYVGVSDGWQDLMDNYQMDWEFSRAEDGNIALTAEIDLSPGPEFMLGVAFGRTPQSASTKLLQSLAIPFEHHRAQYIKQWQRTLPPPETDLSDQTGNGGGIYRLSRLILLAHEDKVYPGALVASMSIPWGETKGDVDLGGYHLVWTRDLVKSASALLACGQTATPLRSLIWLACVQDKEGALPQNSWINGDAYWQGRQLDELAAPILLAWRLQRAKALGQFDPWPMVSRAARYLVLHGPVTGQERWEENSGYSPSTLAWVIAGLVCAAEFARDRGGDSLSPQSAVLNNKRGDESSPPLNKTAEFLLTYADWLSSHLEEWTVTNKGELLPGKPRHYLRITPADPNKPDAIADPDNALVQITNGGGVHPAHNLVSLDFLELVRLGVRSALDPVIVDSVAVIDTVLKHDLPQGPGWRRYNHDGYGQKDDGTAFDGGGTGRCWPLLTGERGHYELAAGRDPMPYIRAMEKFANEGGMLPEQVWDADDLPEARMFRGGPTGSAMPLCWSHAEYLTLVRSRKDGVGFDLIPPVQERYAPATRPATIDPLAAEALAKVARPSSFEIWTLAHQPARIAKGKTLRIITDAPVVVHWSSNAWITAHDQSATETGLRCWYADLPSAELAAGGKILFTFHWQDRWEGRDYSVLVG